MNLVIVESPAKAKTINKYLGKDYEVIASYGHIRDLLAKDGSVRPDEDFAMDYVVDEDSKKHVAAIAKAAAGAKTLYLATDPDREGEAIAWHVLEALKERKALKSGTTIKRIAFNAITKQAVTDALQHPRDLDMNLIGAQQARRALDYLVGFNLSPVLWRKLPGSKSAGRVQSVALRLICDREQEIESFVSQEYWDVRAIFANQAGVTFPARLTIADGKKLEKFSIVHGTDATSLVETLKRQRYQVANVESKEIRRNPPPPFTTSTLQMDAARQLGFSAKKTMQIAQKLYEAGIITYMRTDGVQTAPEAVQQAREVIEQLHGANFVPEKPRFYKSKTKNAQEAHEAIRPTDISRLPGSAGDDGEQQALYGLIWKRMVASQMEQAVLFQTAVDIASSDKQYNFRATGTVTKFAGFLTLYQEGKDDDPEDEDSSALPPLKAGDDVHAKEIKPEQHFTEPPPRYSEASLVKKLEELGIGRPSTYASILSVLQERDYVRLEKKRFIAEGRGRLVNAFLVSFFEHYVEYDFTADLENRLDAIADGEIPWKQVLKDFWKDFIAAIEEAGKLKGQEVLQALENLLAPYIFRKDEAGNFIRNCPACGEGTLNLKLGKFGAFLGCNRYPECRHTKPLEGGVQDSAQEGQLTGNQELGVDPVTNFAVSIRKGPYGWYVERKTEDEKKPARVSLPRGMTPESVTLEIALKLLSLPREVGKHPESGKPIMAGIGRFGPYLLHDHAYTRIPAGESVLEIGINRAVDLVANKVGKPRVPARVLGEHPDGGNVSLKSGRFGPYLEHGQVRGRLPKDADPATMTLEEALAILSKSAKKAPAKPSKATKAKTATKKAAAKPAAKKAAPKRKKA